MRILLIIILLTLTSFTSNSNSGCLKMDIIILIDYSGSVENYEYFIADAFSAFFNRFDLSEEGIRIGAYKFADDVTKITDLTSNKLKLIQASNIMKQYKASGGTNLLNALYSANSEFINNGRQGVQKSLIIISDGLPSGSSNASPIYGTPYNYGVQPIVPISPNNTTNGMGTTSFSCKNTVNNMKKTIPELTVYGIMIGQSSEGEGFMKKISDFYVASSYNILSDELERLDMCF